MTPDGDAAWPGFETWHDRVVRTTDGQADAFAIDEVYDDAEGRPHTRTVGPAHPAGETLAEHTEDLPAYQAAPTQPVLDDAVFQQHAASGPAVAVVLPPEHQFEGAGLWWRRDHHVHPVRPREGGSCAARHRLSRLKAVRNNLLTIFCRGARALHGA
jgi:hypothetical protein